MQKRKPDLSALNHMPLNSTVSRFDNRPVETVGLMKLYATDSKPARPSFLRRVLGRKTA